MAMFIKFEKKKRYLRVPIMWYFFRSTRREKIIVENFSQSTDAPPITDR